MTAARLRPLALLVAAAAALAAPPARAQVPAPASDSAAVLAVVQRLFDTMRTRDTATMRTLFEPGARLVGMRATPDGGQRLQSIPLERWLAAVAGATRGPWVERAFAPEVRLDGTLATVWAAYDFHFGTTPSHCGTDAVQLLKTGERWVIVSIADTYRTDGCPTREPPRP